MNDGEAGAVVVAPASKPARDPKNGHFLKGHSGNPGGRPRVPEVMRAALDEAGQLLVDIMRGEVEDPRVSPGQAAIEIIARQVARPTPEIGSGGGERLQSLVDWLAGGDPIDAEFTETTEEK